MKKKKTAKKALISFAAVILVLALAVVSVVEIKPAVQISALGELSMDDSPTAEYSSLMSDTDEIYGWVEDLTSMGVRAVGTEAGDEAREYVKEKFSEFGLQDIETVSSKTDRWECSDWGLTVGGEEISSYYMAHTFVEEEYGSFSTAENGISAEIVYVGDGDESDFENIDVEGKIVVANVQFTTVPYAAAAAISYLYYDPDNTLSNLEGQINPYSANTYPYNYFYAMENGAVGFVGILCDYFDSNEYNNEDYSYIGGQMKIPGYWVTNGDGEKIKNLIADGNSDANIKMTCTNTQVDAGAVVGFLPGNSDEVIMVHSHFDSSTTGGVEDASGSSVLFAIAKYYSQIPQSERERTLMFVEMDTHFSDYDSHDSVIAEYINTDECKILADVCIEHIALEMKLEDGEGVMTGEVDPRIVFVSDSDALVDITKEETVRHNMTRTVILPADIFGDEVPTDADMFYEEGIPIISLISSPLYLYDNCDTEVMVAKDELKPTAETYADIIWRLTELDASEF